MKDAYLTVGAAAAQHQQRGYFGFTVPMKNGCLNYINSGNRAIFRTDRVILSSWFFPDVYRLRRTKGLFTDSIWLHLILPAERSVIRGHALPYNRHWDYSIYYNLQRQRSFDSMQWDVSWPFLCKKFLGEWPTCGPHSASPCYPPSPAIESASVPKRPSGFSVKRYHDESLLAMWAHVMHKMQRVVCLVAYFVQIHIGLVTQWLRGDEETDEHVSWAPGGSRTVIRRFPKLQTCHSSV